MPEIPSIDYSTPDFEEAVEEIIEADRMELSTCMPGIVTHYDSATQTCKVQPCMKRTMVDGEVASRAVIEDVPVVFPRSSSGGVHFPLNVGDSVLLVFSQRSLDEWSDNGGQVALQDSRLHDITDAIAIPGLFPLNGKMSPAPVKDATELRGSKLFIGDHGQSTTGGTIVVAPVPGTALPGAKGNLAIPPGPLDLIKIVETLLLILQNCNYGGLAQAGGGPMDASSTIALGDLLSDLQKLKG